MKRSHLQILLFSFLLMACGGVSAGAQPDEPGFIVITKNPDDQVGFEFENGTSLIDIQSPTGIGSAAFELESGSMPGNIILRLHLKGLEGFRLTSPKDQISASVSGGEIENQTILSSGTESSLLPGHPLWMEIQPAEGYFDITVPQEFIRNAGKMFEIEWIDFYR
jgi:hypothetical protein